MADRQWVVTGVRWCDRVGRQARLLEQRVLPAEVLPDPAGYRVLAQACDCALECNLGGIPCRWAFTRPEHDPFTLP